MRYRPLGKGDYGVRSPEDLESDPEEQAFRRDVYDPQMQRAAGYMSGQFAPSEEDLYRESVGPVGLGEQYSKMAGAQAARMAASGKGQSIGATRLMSTDVNRQYGMAEADARQEAHRRAQEARRQQYETGLGLRSQAMDEAQRRKLAYLSEVRRSAAERAGRKQEMREELGPMGQLFATASTGKGPQEILY